MSCFIVAPPPSAQTQATRHNVRDNTAVGQAGDWGMMEPSIFILKSCTQYNMTGLIFAQKAQKTVLVPKWGEYKEVFDGTK